MNHSPQLHLYEELMLLALHDEKGTITQGFLEHALAGALLSELLLEGWIEVDEEDGNRVRLRDMEPPEDFVLKKAWDLIQQSVKKRKIEEWLYSFAGIYNLKHLVARQLCERGLVRSEEETVLFLFHRKVYPMIDSGPEEEIKARLCRAVESDTEVVEPRTVALISLAYQTGYLRAVYSSSEQKRQEERLKKFSEGELSGRVAGDAVKACQVAIASSVMMSTMVATGSFDTGC